MKYDYYETIKSDILDYVKENKEELRDQFNWDALYDDLFINDQITGNASGSYYCNTWKAEESLCHNMDLLQEACDCFGCSPKIDNPEWCDVSIRCYLLGQVLEDSKSEIMEILENEEEEES